MQMQDWTAAAVGVAARCITCLGPSGPLNPRANTQGLAGINYIKSQYIVQYLLTHVHGLHTVQLGHSSLHTVQLGHSSLHTVQLGHSSLHTVQLGHSSLHTVQLG